MVVKNVSSGRLICFAISMLASSSGFSAGFIIPESSAEGVALSDAMVANSDLAGAFTYNYSSMLFADSDKISVDLIGVLLDVSVSPLSPNMEKGKVDNQASDAVLPSIYITQKISDQYSWGLHIGVPFGLETVWPEDTFSHFQATDTAIGAGGAVAGLHPTKSSIELVTLSPSVGRKINEHFAVAIGFDYYELIKVEMNSVSNQLNGDDNEIGWNVSLQYHADQWSFGASYHSSVDMKITGEAHISGVGPVLAATELGLPDRLQIGAGYQFTDKLFIEFDIERIGWSHYDKLALTSTGGAIPSGTVFSVTTNNWDDVINLRLGLTYKINDNTDLLLGAGYEEKAQGDEFFDATIADADRRLISFGVVNDLSDDWSFKVAYQFVKNTDRTIAGQSYVTQLVNSGGNDSDPNGTDVYNGDYKGNIHLLAIGVTKLF